MYTGNRIVDEIGKMHFEGNVIPHAWYKTLKLDNGKPDMISMLLLSEFIYWYRPKIVRDEQTGAFVEVRKKFKADLLQKSYKDLSDQFGFSPKQIREALIRLENKNVLKRVFVTVETNRGKLPNTLFIELIVEGVQRVCFPPGKDVFPSRETPPSLQGKTITEITTETTTQRDIPVGEQKDAPNDQNVDLTTKIPDDRNPTSGDEINIQKEIPEMQKPTALLFLQTGKKQQLSDDDISCLKMLFKIHTPAAIQQNILQAFERLKKNGSVKVEFEGKDYTISKAEHLPIRYIWNSMKNWTSLKGTGGAKNGKKRTGKVSRGNPNRDNKDYRGEDGHLFA